MAYFDYKVIPAPRRMKKTRGVSSHEELFAITLTDAINEHARHGWEYVRAETLSAESPRGWLRRGAVEEQAVLVFRRERENLDPRIARASASTAPVSHDPAPAAARAQPTREPSFDDVTPASEPLRRREPVMLEPEMPLRPLLRPVSQPGPQLGPAER